jgi:hypothetical protein
MYVGSIWPHDFVGQTRDMHINQKYIYIFVWLCVISEIMILKSQKFAF